MSILSVSAREEGRFGGQQPSARPRQRWRFRVFEMAYLTALAAEETRAEKSAGEQLVKVEAAAAAGQKQPSLCLSASLYTISASINMPFLLAFSLSSLALSSSLRLSRVPLHAPEPGQAPPGSPCSAEPPRWPGRGPPLYAAGGGCATSSAAAVAADAVPAGRAGGAAVRRSMLLAVDARDGRSSAAAVPAAVPAGLAGGATEVATARHLAAPVPPIPPPGGGCGGPPSGGGGGGQPSGGGGPLRRLLLAARCLAAAAAAALPAAALLPSTAEPRRAQPIRP
jgi:hypothetical protein